MRNLPQDSILFDKGMYWECFYKGDLVNGRREGYGIARYTIGDVYEGQWANDLIHGKGTYVSSINQDILLEETKKEIEKLLEKAIIKARQSGISDSQIKDIFELILEE